MSETHKTASQFNLHVTPLKFNSTGWPHPDDLLNRDKEIENLTPVLLGAQSPLTMSIDAPWGAGKTTFIKLWQRFLSHSSCTSIYLNAWESDFAEDPLLPLITCLETWLSELPENTAAKKSWEKAKRFVPPIIKSGAVLAARLATLGSLDLEKEVEKVVWQKD